MEPASAGIVLDSRVIIAAERRGPTVREILEQMNAARGEVEIGLSVVTIAELTPGACRTKTQAQQQRRLEFIEWLSSDVPVHPVTLDIARRAGRIEGQQEAMGIQFAIEDLLIGAIALHLGFHLATLNVRDFQKIPGLSVVQFGTMDARTNRADVRKNCEAYRFLPQFQECLNRLKRTSFGQKSGL